MEAVRENMTTTEERSGRNASQGDFMSQLFPVKDAACRDVVGAIERGGAIIDLFAGCGGMSLGFEFAGFTPILAVEKDDWASETYSFNRPGVKVVTADITTILDPKADFPGIGPVVGIVGGPPCQGFSLSGDRDPKDPRNSLFMD